MVEWLKWYKAEREGFRGGLDISTLTRENSGLVVDVVGSGERGFEMRLRYLTSKRRDQWLSG